MKKILLMMILTMGWLVSFSQTGKPCATLDQNRDIHGMREILMQDGLYYQNLRASYASTINYSIGKNIVTSSKYGMEDILQNTVLLDADFVVPSDYFNGVRYGDVVKFTTLTGQPSNKWAAYRYKGIDYVYAKVSCMNPQKIKKPLVYKEPEPSSAPAPTSPPTQTKEDSSLPKDYGGGIAKAKVQQKAYVYEKPAEKPPKKEFKIWHVVIPVGVLAGIAAALLLKKGHTSGHGIDPPPNDGGGGVIIPPVDTGGPGIDPPPNGG